MTNTPMTSREAFEAWAIKQYSYAHCKRIGEGYYHAIIQSGWEAWQACEQQNQAVIDSYKNTIASKDKEIEMLKIELLDEWVDDRGVAWIRPTSWAYAQVCKSNDKLHGKVEKGKRLLSEEMALKNERTELALQQRQTIAELVEALEDAKSVINSINRAEMYKLTVEDDDEPVFYQRKEWVDWAYNEILPIVTSAIAKVKGK